MLITREKPALTTVIDSVPSTALDGVVGQNDGRIAQFSLFVRHPPPSGTLYF